MGFLGFQADFLEGAPQALCAPAMPFEFPFSLQPLCLLVWDFQFEGLIFQGPLGKDLWILDAWRFRVFGARNSFPDPVTIVRFDGFGFVVL